MLGLIVRTEINANRPILGLSIALNSALLIYMVMRSGESDNAFASLSLLIFFGLTMVFVGGFYGEKRTRLYSQLPVTSQQVFMGTWITIALLLLCQAVFWLMYNLFTLETFGVHSVRDMLVSTTGVALLIFIVEVGLNLAYIKPRYLQGVFILTVILLLAIRDYNDASQRSVVYIFNPERWSGTETLFAIGALIVLFLTDYLIWKRRDHYLD